MQKISITKQYNYSNSIVLSGDMLLKRTSSDRQRPSMPIHHVSEGHGPGRPCTGPVDHMDAVRKLRWCRCRLRLNSCPGAYACPHAADQGQTKRHEDVACRLGHSTDGKYLNCAESHIRMGGIRFAVE